MKERNVLFHGSVASDIWLRTIQITSKEPTAPHHGLSLQLAARDLL